MALAFGLVVGSFLNVCIWRMPRDMSVAHPPSHCPLCNTRLGVRDLFPVLSLLVQGRKCRYCKAPISWRYAVVESLTGVAFVTLFWVNGVGRFPYQVEHLLSWVFDSIFVAALIAIFAIDLEHYIIPDELNLAILVTGLGRDACAWALGSGQFGALAPVPFAGASLPLPASVLGAAVGFAVFAGISLLGMLAFKKEAMGGGDVKLAAAIGAHLGWVGALASFLVAILLGAVLGILAILLRLRKRKEYIPFGPYMVLGAVAVLYAGQWVVPAFLRLYPLAAMPPLRSGCWPGIP